MSRPAQRSPLSLSGLAFAKGTQGVFIPRAFFEFAGGLEGAALLSQLLYWFGETEEGRCRASLELPKFEADPDGRRKPYPDGLVWIAKAHGEWFDECGVSAKEVRRVLEDFERRRWIVTVVKRFNGNPTTHISVLPQLNRDLDDLVRAPDPVLPDGQNQLPEGQKEMPQGQNDVSDGQNVLPEGQRGIARRAEPDAPGAFPSAPGVGSITESSTETSADALQTPSQTRAELASSDHSVPAKAEALTDDPASPSLQLVQEATKPTRVKWAGEVLELSSDADTAVFELWRHIFRTSRPNSVVFTTDRRRVIKRALESYELKTVLDAVRGAAAERQGRKDAGWDDLATILRMGGARRNNVEHFAAVWAGEAQADPVLSGRQTPRGGIAVDTTANAESHAEEAGAVGATVVNMRAGAGRKEASR